VHMVVPILSTGSSTTADAQQEGSTPMRCPYCRHPDSRVVDSREQD
jgi:hypothetical protein